MSRRVPSEKWYEVGAPRRYKPSWPSREQWAIGFGYGYGAVVVVGEGGGWAWRVSDGNGEIVKSGEMTVRDAAMFAAEDAGGALVECRRTGAQR